MQADMIDGVKLEIWWSRLVAIADEAATALLRTAFSTIIRESNDYAVVLMDATGRNIAECQAGIPAFSAVLGVLTPALLERFPAETWRQGDVVITNHPWLATGHLPDITIVYRSSTATGWLRSRGRPPTPRTSVGPTRWGSPT